MKLSWKLKHTLLSTLPYILFAICLIGILLICVPNSEKTAFLLGIAASAIATLITKIIDNFSDGKKMILKIEELSQRFVDYFDEAIKKSNFIPQEHVYNMLQIYYEMCYSCSDVFISKEYKRLSFAMEAVISLMQDEKSSVDKIKEQMVAVVEARKNLKF